MRRTAIWASLCLFLLGSTLARVHAQQISIAGDMNSPSMLMDISLRDADLNEVLTAMFNTTGGKYQLQVGNGVVNRIARLQLVQIPFDKALDAILGTEYSYTRRQIGNGNYLYTISGRSSSSVPDTGATVPSMAPPTAAATSSGSAGSASSGGASSSSSLPTVLTITTKADGTAKKADGTAATTETSVVKIIKVYYLDIENLCSALGGTSVTLFVQSASSGSSGGAHPSTNSGSNNNNNNNNNNSNGYNNNNNNNNNNGYNNNNNNNNNNGYNNNNNNSNRNTGSINTVSTNNTSMGSGSLYR